MSPHAQLDRILIVDDHVIIRRGLRNLLMLRMPHLQVEDVGTLRDLFPKLLDCPIPCLLVLDLQLSDGNAMERIEELRANYPAMRVLIYSMNPERIYAQRVLAMGCSGYLNKEASEDEVIKAIRTVLAGDVYVGLETELRALDHPDGANASPFSRLSKQELLVLDHVLSGMGVTEMAKHMGLSLSTVATYKARLFEKLSVTNALELQTLVNAHGYRRS
ncbi:MAG: response regulator transcription factor [Flavobacteriales bacterium]|nr:response regulator transcription factor [Flavobacteriales bacterium]